MKLIEHFMLSEHTNQLYKKEAISSISLTRDVADKINELVDAYNELAKGNLAKEQEQDGRISKAVLFMKDNLLNSLHDLFETLNASGAFTEIYGGQLAENTKLLQGLNVIITPEMYGAKGDGVQDDTEALLAMIEDIEKTLPFREFMNELPCKNYSLIDFKFSGTYKISKPIVFDTTYGLTLENLKLIASPIFSGEGMLIFKNITRNFKGHNITINGSLAADTCILIHDYTLTFDMTNVEITHFKKYGIYADGKGHELKCVNMRINQYEWGELDNLSNKKDGTGLYLGADRHDNNFTQLIVNYCNKHGIELLGGATVFENSHFYSCDILNKGRYNTFDNCYFDNAPFRTDGFFALTNSLLLKSEGDATPFIYFLAANDASNWLYDTCNLNNNTFKAVDYVSNAIDLGNLTYLPYFNTIGNTFYYVTPFTSHGRLGHTRNPWDEERLSYGDETSGYKIYGNLAIIWGYVSENSFVTYPNGLELAETIHISFERQDNSNPNLIPWANTIRSNQFWVNSVGTGSTVKWVVVGIIK